MVTARFSADECVVYLNTVYYSRQSVLQQRVMIAQNVRMCRCAKKKKKKRDDGQLSDHLIVYIAWIEHSLR